MNRLYRILPLLSILLLALSATAFSAEPARYTRTVHDYTIPDVVLINENGEHVRLKELLAPDQPVVVDFIYGTCTTICPILSAGYTHLQRKLGTDSASARLVSISIDPEHDTPAVMKEYLKRYRAKPGWTFLTGSRKDIDQVMTAFDAYITDKMSHQPLTFIHNPAEGHWVRLFGLLSGKDFMSEYQNAGLKDQLR